MDGTVPQQQDRTTGRLLVPEVAHMRGRRARMVAGWAVLLAVLGHGMIGAWLLPGRTKAPDAPSEKSSIQVFFDQPEVAPVPEPATPQPQPQPQPQPTATLAAPPRAEETHEAATSRHIPASVPTASPRGAVGHAVGPRGTSVPPPHAAPASGTRPASAPPAVGHAPPPASAARPVSSLQCTPPAWRYPAMARHMHEEGTAMVDLVIGAQGQVAQASLRSSTGYDDLDRTALAAARNVRCTAEGGATDGAKVTLPVIFHLKG
ncbi:energy transducer TonB [Komagataeibacter oboediens]